MKQIAIAALFVLAATGATAETAPPAFEETVEVVEVELPVQVVDRAGNPIRGLKRDQFRVADGGKRRRLSGFEVVDRASAATATAATPALEGAARRHILLFFDLTFSSPAAVAKARRAAKEVVISSLHASDLVAVAAYSVEHGPQLILTFTPDRAQAARAIDSLSFERAFEHTSIDPLRFLLAAPGELQGTGGDRPGEGKALSDEVAAVVAEQGQILARMVGRQQQEYARTRVRTWSRDLARFARALSTVSGRKHVVLFSEGFDSRLLLGRSDPGGEEAAAESERAMGGEIWEVDNTNRFGDLSLREGADRMVEELRRADCVVEAVDVGGLRVGGDLGAGSRGEGQDALFFFANSTGGQLFKNTNNLAAQLDEVLERSAVTYLLSFRAEGVKADGSFRRLKIEVDGLPRGARVVHRAGYYAPRPFPALHALERDLLAAQAIASAAPRHELEVDVLAAPFRAGTEAAYVPVIVEVDGAKLFPGAGRSAEVEIYVYGSDARGEMQDFFARTLALRDGGNPARRAGFKYYGHLELPPGEHLLRVLVRERTSGRTGLQTAAVSVPDFGKSPAVMLPPFFVESPGRWLMAREPSAEAGASVIYPFVVNGEPYVPAARPSLDGAGQTAVHLVGYNVSPGSVQLDAQVTAADGSAVEGGRLLLRERTATGLAGVDKWVASFSPAGLMSGEYRLAVALTTPEGERIESGAVAFTVVER